MRKKSKKLWKAFIIFAAAVLVEVDNLRGSVRETDIAQGRDAVS